MSSADKTLMWIEDVNKHVKDGHEVALQVVIYCATCGKALSGPVKSDE